MKKSTKKNILVVLLCSFILTVGVISEKYISKYKDEYKNAKSLLDRDKYEESIKKFEELKKYKLSKFDISTINTNLKVANEKLKMRDNFIEGEKLLFERNYLGALRSYFKINDVKSKYYGSSVERIGDTLNLYLINSIKYSDKNKVKEELEDLLSDLENDKGINSNLYLNLINDIKEVIDIISTDSLENLKVESKYTEKDFEIVDEGFGIEKVRNNKNGLSNTVKIDGSFVNYADYFVYKIPGNMMGRYKLTFSYKGYNESFEGNIRDIQNMLQFYKLPIKPENGDYILINLTLTINGKQTNVNVVNRYDFIKLDK